MTIRRAGYTLSEVLIVLALLAGVAGITWPALMRPWSRSLVQQAACEFKHQLSDVRIRAIEQSQTVRLRWRPGTGEYELSTPEVGDGLNNVEAARVADGTGTRHAVNGQRDRRPSPTTLRLPHDVNFQPVATDPVPEDRSLLPAAVEPEAATADEMGTYDDLVHDNPDHSSQSPSWSSAVWFYPDGGTSNARWTLVSTDGYECDVILRGLTGTVAISPVRQAIAAREPSEELVVEADDVHDTAPIPR